eukprot:3786980-Rhodomonas_salina.1
MPCRRCVEVRTAHSPELKAKIEQERAAGGRRREEGQQQQRRGCKQEAGAGKGEGRSDGVTRLKTPDGC